MSALTILSAAMGVLEHTGERVFIPRPSMEGMLGERTDLPHADYGMDYLRDEVGVADGWFAYGDPIEDVFVYQPELFTHSNLSSDLLFQFWGNTISYAPQEALAAVEKIREVAQGAAGERRTIFEVDFETWDTEKWVSEFVKELHQLLMAHRPEDVLRDDRNDTGADAKNPHYTETREGLLGASTVFLITRSRIGLDKWGREIVARLIEVVKPQPDMVDDILCELSLTEELRVAELLLREKATQAEWDYVAAHADRRTMRRDRQSVKELIAEHHYVPETPRWRKIVSGLGSLVTWARDSSLIRRLAGEKPQGRGRHSL